MSLAMGQRLDIVVAEHIGGYRLSIRFSDGHERVVDFGPFLRAAGNPETIAFLDKRRFKAFSIRYGNLVWGDYALCFPIEDLYEGELLARADPAESNARAVAESPAHCHVARGRARASRTG